MKFYTEASNFLHIVLCVLLMSVLYCYRQLTRTMEVPQLKPVQDVPEIDLDDIDKLLESLSPEELEELNGDFDPDVSSRFIDLFRYP